MFAHLPGEAETDAPVNAPPKPPPLFEGHREFQENQRGVSYETLLLPYLRGSTEITMIDRMYDSSTRLATSWS